jgi:hypothetical protein
MSEDVPRVGSRRLLTEWELAEWHNRLHIIQTCRAKGQPIPGPRLLPNPFFCEPEERARMLPKAVSF